MACSGLSESGLPGPDFGRYVHSISTRGADYAHQITACPPGFENLTASLHCIANRNNIHDFEIGWAYLMLIGKPESVHLFKYPPGGVFLLFFLINKLEKMAVYMHCIRS